MRTALVTGASRGIGLATARAFIAQGLRVIGVARTITPDLEATGAHPVAADLTTPDGVSRMIREAGSDIDVLVNNVGGGDGAASALHGFLDVADAEWRSLFDVNFFTAVRVTRAALPALLARRGVIVSVSSIGARVPAAGPIAYNTAKAALTALGKALAEEFGPAGVRVVTVSPGPVRTAVWEAPDGLGAQLAAAAHTGQQEFLGRVPAMMGMTTGRFAEPAEVADLIAYLASPQAASITGADFLIDGGLVKTA
jgi:NAD(P)-dependent dehydrogenase (short-subunit alcohol dehydrogenase family)